MENKKTLDVLVIGAGMSGLSAAHRIYQSNKSMLVLEARDRIGGRLSSERFEDGLLFERGGELIHGSSNLVYPLVKELGIEIRELGKADSDTSFRENVAMLFVGMSLRFGWYPKPREQESIQEYLSRLRFLPRSAKEAIEHRSIDFESLDRISALHLIHRIRRQIVQGEVYGEHDYLIRDGYVTLLNHLAKDVPIKLSHVVQRIVWNDELVVVQTNRGNFETKKLVVTVPINVLCRMDFEPELPESKMNAMNAHTALDIVKFIVPVPASAFRTDKEQGVIPNAQLVPMWWRRNFTSNSSQDRQVLVGWITGPYARNYISLSPDEAIERTVEELSRIVDPDKVNRKEIIAQNWTDDEFALGPYYYVKPGFPLHVVEDLAEPLDDKLYFASAAVSDEAGTAHGAYESGLRAAREVLS